MSLLILVAGGVGFFAGSGISDVLQLAPLFDQVMAKAKLPIKISGQTIAALFYLAVIPGLAWKYVDVKGAEFVKYGIMGLSLGIGFSLLGVL